jgi:hypothetical protein
LIVVADPAVSDTAPEAACDATVTVCTVTVAPVEITVGVTVTDATLLGTVAVYEVVPAAKAGDSEPALTARALSVLIVLSDGARRKVTVYVLIVIGSPIFTTTGMIVSPMDSGLADEVPPETTSSMDVPTVMTAAA